MNNGYFNRIAESTEIIDLGIEETVKHHAEIITKKDKYRFSKRTVKQRYDGNEREYRNNLLEDLWK